MKKRGHFTIEGRVQGVCYRMFAAEEAESLGLTGWVKNLPDGAVEIVAEGEETDLRQFLDICRRGPPAAHVTRISEEYGEPTGSFGSFRVAY
jgi:acylphosphatase